jgi:hypothetical protein
MWPATFRVVQNNWTFFCFDDAPWTELRDMILEIYRSGIKMKVEMIPFRKGELWNGKPCRVVFVPKDAIAREVIHAGVCKHLGIDPIDPTREVFILGIDPGEETELCRRGRFLK